MISLRCTPLVSPRSRSSARGSASIRSLATSPARCGASTDARCCAAQAAAAARCGSIPFARNAATMPGEDVARCPRSRATAARARRRGRRCPGAATSESCALEHDDAAEALGRLPHGGEPVRGDLAPTRGRAAAPSSPSCGVSTRGAGHSPGSSPCERVRVGDDRQLDLREHAADELLRTAAPRPSPGPSASACAFPASSSTASAAPSPASPSGVRERPLHRLEQPLLEDRQRRLRGGDGDVARVGAHRRHARSATARRSARASRRRRARGRRCTCCRGSPRRGTSARIAARHEARARSRPARARCPATCTSPAWKRPGATASPTLTPWKVTVAAASHGGARDLAASRRRRRTAGRSRAPARSTRSSPRSAPPRPARGSPENPVPKSASTITSGSPRSRSPAFASTIRVSRPASSSRRAVTRPSPPFEPPPQTSVQRRASGKRGAARARRQPAPARSISSGIGVRVAGVALLGAAHLGGACRGAQSHPSTTATACASSRECVIERSIAPAPSASARAATRPERRTDGFGRPTISISFQAKARATPKPSALPTASLPAKRPGVALGGVGPRVAVGLLGRR